MSASLVNHPHPSDSQAHNRYVDHVVSAPGPAKPAPPEQGQAASLPAGGRKSTGLCTWLSRLCFGAACGSTSNRASCWRSSKVTTEKLCLMLKLRCLHRPRNRYRRGGQTPGREQLAFQGSSTRTVMAKDRVNHPLPTLPGGQAWRDLVKKEGSPSSNIAYKNELRID